MRKEIIGLATLIIYAATLMAGFVIYGKQQNTNAELENKIGYLEFQLQETEARCSRMTDTCIDILANRRWEEGSK